MSSKLASPRDLFLQLLAQMLWVERMLAFEVLPALHKQVESESLAAALAEHLSQSHEHVARVEGAFHALGVEPASTRSGALAALQREHEERSAELTDPRLADLFHAGAAMHGEHLELAGYEVLLLLARELGRDDVAGALEQNRADEAETLDRLRGLAERMGTEG
jgi:ferritin-like metal-binding protein YciE